MFFYWGMKEILQWFHIQSSEIPSCNLIQASMAMPYVWISLVVFLLFCLVLSEYAVFRWVWQLMAGDVKPCLGLGTAPDRHMSFPLLYWLFFFIWVKYNFYLTSFRVTVGGNRSTARDIHDFLWSCVFISSSSPRFVHSLTSPFLQLASSFLLFFTFLWPCCLNCSAGVIQCLRFTENNILPQDFPHA